jgi:ABC-2 type transport system ATP-binding protein
MDEAEYLADRIIVLAGGEIVAEGTPATLGGRDRTAARITFTLPATVRPEWLPPPFVEVDGRGEARTTRPLDDLRTLAAWASGAGVDLPDLEVRRATLEDIYLELTGATSA